MSEPLELTEKDFETIFEAFDTWEKSPDVEELNKSMLTVLVQMALGKMPNENLEVTLKQAHEKARQQIVIRKQMLVMLRAKVEMARQKLQTANINNANAPLDS